MLLLLCYVVIQRCRVQLLLLLLPLYLVQLKILFACFSRKRGSPNYYPFSWCLVLLLIGWRCGTSDDWLSLIPNWCSSIANSISDLLARSLAHSFGLSIQFNLWFNLCLSHMFSPICRMSCACFCYILPAQPVGDPVGVVWRMRAWLLLPFWA